MQRRFTVIQGGLSDRGETQSAPARPNRLAGDGLRVIMQAPSALRRFAPIPAASFVEIGTPGPIAQRM